MSVRALAWYRRAGAGCNAPSRKFANLRSHGGARPHWSELCASLLSLLTIKGVLNVKREKRKRFYEVKSGDQTEVAILPGENPLEFERLHTRLAEEWAPDGLLEENAVLTIAKCIWRRRWYQRFILSIFTTESFDEDRYKMGQQELLAFHKVLVEGAAEHEIRRELDRQRIPWDYHLLKYVPRHDFENTEVWAKAMANEIKESLLPEIANRLDRAEKAIFRKREIPGPTSDELFDRELRFDERNEAALQRAIDRLLELKQAKRPISFRAMQRFERTHADRLHVRTFDKRSRSCAHLPRHLPNAVLA
jgi:hypothetical protein